MTFIIDDEFERGFMAWLEGDLQALFSYDG